MFAVELNRKNVPAAIIRKENIQTRTEAEQFAATLLQQPSRIVGLESILIFENNIEIKRIPVGSI